MSVHYQNLHGITTNETVINSATLRHLENMRKAEVKSHKICANDLKLSSFNDKKTD